MLGSGVQSQGGCDISSYVGQGMPRQGRTLSLGVSMRVFLEENSTGIGRLGKDHLPQCALASFNPLMVLIEQNGGGGASSLPLLELDVPPLTLC